MEPESGGPWVYLCVRVEGLLFGEFCLQQLVYSWPVWEELTAVALPFSVELTLSVSPSIQENCLSLGGKVFALNGTVSSRIEAD